MRIVLFSLLLVMLQGCSAIKLGYNKLDDLAYWWLDGYADFSPTQSDKLRTSLGQLMRWHREQELPAYAMQLQQLQAMATDNITPTQICTIWESIQKRLDLVAIKALPGLAEVAVDLSPKQLAHIERQWAKKNANWQEEWLQGPPAQREQKRLDAFVDRFESFYGNLTAAQSKLVQQQLQQSAWTPEWGWQDRLQKQQQWMAAMRSFQTRTYSPEQAQEVLRQLYVNATSTSSGPGFEMRQRLQQQACTNLAQLHNITTLAQRQKAAQRLKAYANDLKDLAGS
jgi:hypothetical protein